MLAVAFAFSVPREQQGHDSKRKLGRALIMRYLYHAPKDIVGDRHDARYSENEGHIEENPSKAVRWHQCASDNAPRRFMSNAR
jgi:hypothetical protein